MRTRATLLIMLLATILCQGQQWMTVHWPVPGTIVKQGQHFDLNWNQMGTGKWRIEVEKYTLNLNDVDVSKRPFFKTHDDLPHDFMYNPLKTVHSRDVLYSEWKQSKHDIIHYTIPCENPWLWTQHSNVPLQVDYNQLNPFIIDNNTTSVVDFSSPVNNNSLYVNRIIFRGFGPNNKRFYTYVDVVDSDPNFQPDAPQVVLQCDTNGVDICVAPYRFNEVDDAYAVQTSVIPESRDLLWYQIPHQFGLPPSVGGFTQLLFQGQVEPTSILDPISPRSTNHCLNDFKTRNNELVELIYVQAERPVGEQSCLDPNNRVYDKSALAPVLVVNVSALDLQDPLLQLTGHEIKGGTVYSDQALVCEAYRCELTGTYFEFPSNHDVGRSLEILMNNTPVGNFANLQVSSISWQAYPAAYFGYTAPTGEDFITMKNGKPRVCYTDLNHGYENNQGNREMTYRGTYEIKMDVQGTTTTCSGYVDVVVDRNTSTAGAVNAFNTAVSNFLIGSVEPTEVLCDMLWEFYHGVQRTTGRTFWNADTIYQNVNGLRSHQLFDSILSRFGNNPGTEDLLNVFFDVMDLDFAWESNLAIADTSSFLSQYKGIIQPGDTVFLPMRIKRAEEEMASVKVLALVGENWTIAASARKVFEAKDLNLDLYPNPSQNELNLSHNLGLPTKYSIINVLGEELKSGEISENLESIDISKLNPNSYILILQGLDGQQTTSYFTKMD